MNQHLIEQITKLVVEELRKQNNLSKTPESKDISDDSMARALAYRKELNETCPVAVRGNNPREVVIGVGAAFQGIITKTLSNIHHKDLIRTICAGIEEEGMTPRIVKIMDTSDVCFMALEAAKLSGSGIGIGVQSKGTTVIHQKDLYPLSNLELFPQAPMMSLETYRRIGQNAARYVKGEGVIPIPGENNPMVRAEFQVKAAIMHIKETEIVTPRANPLEWGMQ